ncbi:MAG TPA: hypothetical protein ENK50_02160 [Sedimenticola sp.]|nr:hypothetical protein [Sedimenticola sp.]
MDTEETDLVKTRQIAFTELHPDPRQAETAARMLSGVDGILETRAPTPTLLEVRYHVLEVTLEQIETALTETGFHLSSRLIHKLQRALYYYTEDVQRANNGCRRGDSNCTRKIFIESYQRRDHRLRDPRPEHWRRYL